MRIRHRTTGQIREWAGTKSPVPGGEELPGAGTGASFPSDLPAPGGGHRDRAPLSAAYLQVLPSLRLAPRTTLLRAALLLHGTLHQGLVFLLRGLQLRD